MSQQPDLNSWKALAEKELRGKPLDGFEQENP